MSKRNGELRRGEITLKDMGVLRDGDSARKQWKQNCGVLRDYGLQHRVALKWDESDAPRHKELPFWLIIDDKRAVLNYLELRDLDRSGFFTNYGESAKPYRLKDMDGKRATLSLQNLNHEAERDCIFRLQLDDYEVIADWEEFQRLARFI